MIPFDLVTWAMAAAIVGAAYIVFGISAFGAALFTVPLLALMFPLEFVLPLCVLLDVAAAMALGSRFSGDADWGELKWMMPLSVVGAVSGVTLLVSLPSTATLSAFGVFLMLYSVFALRSRGRFRRVRRGWAPLAGWWGGVTGTLFGIGAPPYVIYLSHRLEAKSEFRATLSNMVLFSTSTRAIVFFVMGLMLLDRLVAFVLLVPFVFLGLWLGNRIHARVSREAVQRVAAILILVMGAVLVVRALQG